MDNFNKVISEIKSATNVKELKVAEAKLKAIELGVSPPAKLAVIIGKKVRITVSTSYQGTAISPTLYAAIGSRGLIGFDELKVAQKTWSLPASSQPTTQTTTIDIDTTGMKAATGLDIYCKIIGHDDAGYPEVDDVIDLVSSNFQNFKISDYSQV